MAHATPPPLTPPLRTPTPPPSPLLALPPEILHRIICFAAASSPPSLLATLHQTSRTLHGILSSPSRALDRAIWQPVAHSLLGACTPPAPPALDGGQWQRFVRRIWALARAPQDTDTFHVAGEGATLGTSELGPFPAERWQLDWGPRLAAARCMPRVPAGARRELDFLHSSTEASRNATRVPYCAVGGGAFAVFSDHPHEFALTPGTFERGFVRLDGGPAALGRHAASGEAVARLAGATAAPGLNAWLRTATHSDADLVLHAEPVADTEDAYGGQPHVARVDRLAVVDGAAAVECTWDLSASGGWHGLDLAPTPLPPAITTWSTWEFRSAGSYLAVCADHNGAGESTLSCFTPASAAPHWQRRLDSASPPGFHDNDGLRMTSTLIAYATRSIVTPERAPLHARCTFQLFSTATGELVRTLTLPQESRLVSRDVCAWTSLSLSDSLLAATVGGLHISTASHGQPARYQYPHILVWSLVDRDAPHDYDTRAQPPTWTLPLPRGWAAAADTYTALSPCGRYLGASQAWVCAVWDVRAKRRVAAWRVPGARRYRAESGDAPWRVLGWNGLWVKFRDVWDAQGETVHGMVYLSARQVRRALGGECPDSDADDGDGDGDGDGEDEGDYQYQFDSSEDGDEDEDEDGFEVWEVEEGESSDDSDDESDVVPELEAIVEP
ncbi:hypothetical protein EDC01DRAFT_636338 [Geopyxis carbonaria]|nr:hypothetical protein EDC01DRAFT_636338 [Geopyxis carbonaria]